MTAPVEITGVRRTPRGDLSLVEVEVSGGSARVRLGQLPDSPTGAPLCAVLVDGAPVALVLAEDEPRFLALPSEGEPLPPAAETEPGPDPLSEAAVSEALGPLLPALSEGLYSVTRVELPAPRQGQAGPETLPVDERRVLDPGPVAPDAGGAVVLELAPGLFLLLSGRRALASQGTALSVSGSFIVEAEGFSANRHDRAARERYARSPSHLLDDLPVRDALAASGAAAPEVELGPFHPDVLEPAGVAARAVLFDLGFCDLGPVGQPTRLSEAGEVAWIAPLEDPGSVILVSSDGRRLTEGRVRLGDRWAAGLRPTARALSRALRRLREGA